MGKTYHTEREREEKENEAHTKRQQGQKDEHMVATPHITHEK